MLEPLAIQVETNRVARAFGCSVKSFPVFGPKGAPIDLVRALWEQWRATAPQGFQVDRDALALITAQHAPEVRETWFGLTDGARVTDPSTFAARLTSDAEPSGSRRTAFASVLHSDASETPEKDARLLGRLFLLEHDIQHANSRTATQCIALAQQALSDASRDRATDCGKP